MENQEQLIPHLFRTEYSKITSVLCKLFGIAYIETAEDIVSDTFLLAAETWGLKGLPQNPTAWLYAVAKNKAKDFLKHQQVFNQKISPAFRQTEQGEEEINIDLSNTNITNSQLQMMFAICHPSIPTESQIGLSLNILCGFGVHEIADAFLSSKDTIYKRLTRAKEKLRTEQIKMELPPPEEINNRIEAVITTLYLLFSEGYYSTSQNTTLRKDLCIEAMRLSLMLTENELTNTPELNALISLMCFHASRFEARTNTQGELVVYEEQDETLWNRELIDKGLVYLNKASVGKHISKYHLEAAIAYWHTHKTDTPEKWENILQLYNKLLQIEYSPMAALNRTYALSKANGKAEAIREAEKLQLHSNHLYHLLLANLYEGVNPTKTRTHLQQAYELARTETEKIHIEKKIQALPGSSGLGNIN
jgi:RNA polymerase sigma factor (sigma-70 family)